MRVVPDKSGPGFPTPQYKVFNCGSKVPVIQVEPPPRVQESPNQLSPPGSPFAGTVQKRQARFPVAASHASINPRMPNAPPEIPTIALSLITIGASVAVCGPGLNGAISVCQIRRPVRASSDTTFPSNVTMNN